MAVSPSSAKKLVFLCFLSCDEVFELFLLALKLSERNLTSRSSRLHCCHLLLTLLHEAVAEDTGNGTYCEANPKSVFWNILSILLHSQTSGAALQTHHDTNGFSPLDSLKF